jgi:serine/threonine protein kinase
MTGLRHPNITLFMGVCLEPPDLCIITEFMMRGSLHDVLHNDKLQLPFPLLRNMIVDILKGLQFIHSAGIIHRDLKSPNLLVDKNWTIKVSLLNFSLPLSSSPFPFSPLLSLSFLLLSSFTPFTLFLFPPLLFLPLPFPLSFSPSSCFPLFLLPFA